MTPTLPLAFTAGVLSFLSPCVLPLVPVYLGYVGGSGTAAEKAGGRLVLRNSLLFIVGFSLIFVALGASASALGNVLRVYRTELTVAGGVLIVLFGLVMLGVFRLPFMERDVRFRFRGNGRTPVGAVLLGMAFALGWSPCIGPVLGSILGMAGVMGTLGQGVLLLGSYALGLALPFFLAAMAVDRFLAFSKRFRRYVPWVQRVAGGLLVAAGVMMVTGNFTALNAYLNNFTPDWLGSRL